MFNSSAEYVWTRSITLNPFTISLIRSSTAVRCLQTTGFLPSSCTSARIPNGPSKTNTRKWPLRELSFFRLRKDDDSCHHWLIRSSISSCCSGKRAYCIDLFDFVDIELLVIVVPPWDQDVTTYNSVEKKRWVKLQHASRVWSSINRFSHFGKVKKKIKSDISPFWLLLFLQEKDLQQLKICLKVFHLKVHRLKF